jgi:osmotically-inducible protein OsmY
VPPGAGAAHERVAADEVLANAVYSKLNADPIYFFRHVEVKVDNGVADLSGYVWSTDAIYRARAVTRQVPGVTGVVTSRLELERNGRDTGPAR